MAVYIDPPTWPGHGTYFSHLVSDRSLAELHAMAATAGITERAFDRDHYDVPLRRYPDLIQLGAIPVGGRQLTRLLIASGLRIPARQRSESLETALQLRWEATLPGQPGIGSELLTRWAEPHRHYHARTHLLGILEAIETLSSEPPRSVLLAAWFHDAVYRGEAGRDEAASVALAGRLLRGRISEAERLEVQRLVELTAEHQPDPADFHGALLCDADLAILGSDPQSYADYLHAVRRDYAHVSDTDFLTGRAVVVERLLALDPLYRLPAAQKLWLEQAKINLSGELAH